MAMHHVIYADDGRVRSISPVSEADGMPQTGPVLKDGRKSAILQLPHELREVPLDEVLRRARVEHRPEGPQLVVVME